MKKLLLSALAAMLALGLAACGAWETDASGQAAASETVTITGLNAAQEAVEVEVPHDPQRIAALDLMLQDLERELLG